MTGKRQLEPSKCLPYSLLPAHPDPPIYEASFALGTQEMVAESNVTNLFPHNMSPESQI